MTQYAPLIDQVCNIAKRAGLSTLTHFQAAGSPYTTKADGSPVTLADPASEEIIIAGLQTLTPTIPIVAEEQQEFDNTPIIDTKKSFWLVDPLDGTREFIKGSPDFTVNIALIHEGTPILGVVYIPAEDNIYFGGEGIGAYFNGQAITTDHSPDFQALNVIASKNSPKEAERKAFLEHHDIQIGSYVMRGSSLKFCMIADGQADLYPRTIPTYEWDTAAAHALLLQTGGDIIDTVTKKRLTYGKHEKRFLNGSLITGTTPVLRRLGF